MKEFSSNKDTTNQNLTTYAALMKFSEQQKNEDKIKFDKVWVY